MFGASVEQVQERANRLLEPAGVRINPSDPNPWDIQMHDPKVIGEVLSPLGGSRALGNAYMDGRWDCKDLFGFFTKVLSSGLAEEVHPMSVLRLMIQSRLTNMQTVERSKQVGRQHYDVSNELYAAMLDKTMTYSCAYWDTGARDLDEAQEAKLDLICRKLKLQELQDREEGGRILDIGCGWGGLAEHIAKRYPKISVVGLTISKEQALLAKERVAGLDVDILVQDYRDPKFNADNEGKFDRVVSVGMFEHVGRDNHRKYMKIVNRLMKDDGLFLLHTIGFTESGAPNDPWIEQHIFPNSQLPSEEEIAKATAGLLIGLDSQNLGDNYVDTLLAWSENFEKAWPELAGQFDETFYRMWRYYLAFAAATFAARDRSQLYQTVYRKHSSKAYGRYIREC